MIAVTKYLFTKRFNGQTVYVHNLFGYDANFLLKRFIDNTNLSVEPRFNKTQMVSMSVGYGPIKPSQNDEVKRKYSLKFYDSYLILPLSLEKLAKTFSKDVSKGMFPLKAIHNSNFP